MSVALSWICVAFTIALTVYGQLVTKWQVLKAGPLPVDAADKFLFLLKLAFNPWMISVFGGLFLASLCWMGAMSRLPLSSTYPFTSLSFVLILLLSGLFFSEPVTLMKVLGLIFIVVGLFIGSRG